MADDQAFFGMHPPGVKQTETETETVVTDAPVNETPESVSAVCPEEAAPVQEVVTEAGTAEEQAKAADELTARIGQQTETIDSLVGMVRTLTEEIRDLKAQVETAKEERTVIQQTVGETRASLAQYVRTNALPHDVLRLLQRENESMIRKLEVRPQTDILRAVRDYYVQLGNSRDRYERAGNAEIAELLDMLMIALQEDVMEDHGVEILRSAEGTLFKATRMKQEGSLPTPCKEKHMQVAGSLAVGFQFDKEVLLKERVALYQYDPALEQAQETAEEATEAATEETQELPPAEEPHGESMEAAEEVTGEPVPAVDESAAVQPEL